MASSGIDEKRVELGGEQRIENLTEKGSTSSGEIEAQRVELDEAEANRVLRKVDYRLVPMLALLYLVAFIDRSNSEYSSLHGSSWSSDTNQSQLAMPKLLAWIRTSASKVSSTTRQ